MSTHSTPVKESAPIVEADTTKGVDKSNSRIDVEDSFFVYGKKYGAPYTKDFFGLENFAAYKKNPQLDIDNVVPRVEMVEKYILDNIEFRGLMDNLDTYQFLIDEILAKIGDIEVEELPHKFNRVAKYIEKNQDVERKMEIERLKQAIKELEYGHE